MILALDYGEKRIGVAVSDEGEKFAKALECITHKSEPGKISVKDFPHGTSQEVIQEERRKAKSDRKLEERKLFNKILHLVTLHYPEKILIGLPTTADATTGRAIIGKQAKKVQRFAKKLESFLKKNNILVEIIFVEESMTSVDAEKKLRAEGLGSKRIKARIDSESAKCLFESFSR